MKFYLALFIIVPAILYAIKIGPVDATAQWKQQAPLISDQISDFVKQYQIKYREKQGIDVSKIEAHFQPDVKSVVMDEPIMPLRMPEVISFQGRSTDGFYKGTYHLNEKRFEGSIDINQTPHNVKARIGNDGKMVYDASSF